MIEYYKVGGCVRDEILGIKSKDIDYAVVADSYDAMKSDLLSKGTFIYQERPEFFAIRGRHPDFGNVDFTLCRKEGFYSDIRHPDSVELGTIYDDLARRDFTINAIAVAEDGTVIDPHGGRGDISNNLLRCVGDPSARFSEDALRIMRAVRFHIVRDFDLTYSVENALNDKKILSGLLNIPLERVYEELRKCYEYSTTDTMFFFRWHQPLERIIFDQMGMQLSPRIGNVA